MKKIISSLAILLLIFQSVSANPFDILNISEVDMVAVDISQESSSQNLYMKVCNYGGFMDRDGSIVLGLKINNKSTTINKTISGIRLSQNQCENYRVGTVNELGINSSGTFYLKGGVKFDYYKLEKDPSNNVIYKNVYLNYGNYQSGNQYYCNGTRYNYSSSQNGYRCNGTWYNNNSYNYNTINNDRRYYCNGNWYTSSYSNGYYCNGNFYNFDYNNSWYNNNYQDRYQCNGTWYNYSSSQNGYRCNGTWYNKNYQNNYENQNLKYQCNGTWYELSEGQTSYRCNGYYYNINDNYNQDRYQCNGTRYNYSSSQNGYRCNGTWYNNNSYNYNTINNDRRYYCNGNWYTSSYSNGYYCNGNFYNFDYNSRNVDIYLKNLNYDRYSKKITTDICLDYGSSNINEYIEIEFIGNGITRKFSKRINLSSGNCSYGEFYVYTSNLNLWENNYYNIEARIKNTGNLNDRNYSNNYKSERFYIDNY